VIALIYFSLDLDRIIRFIEGILPEKIKSRVTNIKENVISLVWKYLKSYFFIMLITFTVMALGLFILRVDNLLLISLIIAALDILPVIGVGTVLIPWSLFSFFRADLFRGVGLLILFMVNAIIRQLAEPKILGKNLNLRPLLTLVFIYVGYSLFGFAGIILLPVIGVVVSVYLKKNTTAEVTEITACDTDGS
jgi:sporulation integral membrane protein YtvI